jgi:hypothetical protein
VSSSHTSSPAAARSNAAPPSAGLPNSSQACRQASGNSSHWYSFSSPCAAACFALFCMFCCWCLGSVQLLLPGYVLHFCCLLAFFACDIVVVVSCFLPLNNLVTLVLGSCCCDCSS